MACPEMARCVKEQTYSSIEPLGICEDDDNGKAAATSLLLALDPDYYPGGEFVIETNGDPRTCAYIQGATVNGEPLRGPWLRHRDLVQGGVLSIELGREPNTAWGSRIQDAPPSG